MDNAYTNWRTATYSNGSGQCVEAASNARTVAVRDSINRDGGTLAFAADVWAAFTASLK
jgi:Domain of unknown function (DUF397)